mgnify:CR=1 FL=1
MCWSASPRWGGTFDVDSKSIQLEEEELRTQAPEFWDDAKAAEVQMRKIKELKKWIDGYSGVKTAIEELQLAYDFYREEVATEEEVDEAYRLALEQIETLELQNMLSKEEEKELIDNGIDNSKSYWKHQRIDGMVLDEGATAFSFNKQYDYRNNWDSPREGRP